VKGLADLAREDVKVGLTDPAYSTTGHVLTMALERGGLKAAVEDNVTTRTRQGGEAANAVGLGALDATVVWDAVVHLRREKLDSIPIEPRWLPVAGIDVITSPTYGPIDMGSIAVTIATLKCSKQPEAAKAFAEYVAGAAAAGVFDKFGFSPAVAMGPIEDAVRAGRKIEAIMLYRKGSGKGLAEAKEFVEELEKKIEAEGAEPLTGTILVHCGAGLRKPVAKLAAEFAEDTGVEIQTNYTGSNLLLGQIDLTRKGDVYIPGDADYVEMARAKGLVASSKAMCYFVPVIMVARGNPKGVRTLADLAKPGLRLGLGDEKACAVGRLTSEILTRAGVDAAGVKKNLVLSTPTVNELGLKIKLGTIDATVVWSSTAAQYAGASETVAIPARQNIIPTVPVAVLTTSKNPTAAARFAEFLRSNRSREVFAEFHFVVEKPGE